ncbi:MAG: outer membrane beta-barrel protein [Vicinamibacterales bacterium]
MSHKILCVLGCLTALVPAAVAAAQTTAAQAAAANARIHYGPLALDPKFALRDMGVDTNVFNDAATPQRDFTAHVVPSADAWLRVGRGTISSVTTGGWTYFRRAARQRSFDLSQEGRVELGLARAVPWLDFGYVQTRQRPNLEIDTRVRQHVRRAGAGITLNPGARLEVVLEAGERRLSFAQGDSGDVQIANVLDRTERQAKASLRYRLTPLTTFVLRTAAGRTRFGQASLRDSRSISVVPGFELKPAALISGKGFVGVRRFTGDDPMLPRFTGVVAEVDAGYVLRELTRLSVRLTRDLDYSIEEAQPYFLLTGGELSVTQAIGTSWDVVARAGRSVLDYQAIVRTGEAGPAPVERRDRVVVYGAGLGRHLRSAMRLGVDIAHVERRSIMTARNYSGARVGGTVTYGF